MSEETKRGAKAPRTITPHKDGRTIKVSSDVTPETKAKIVELRKQGVSLGDLIQWAASRYVA